MAKKIALLSFAVLVAAIFYYKGALLHFSLRFPELKKVTNSFVEEIKKEVVAPPPLRIFREAPQSFLTRSGVVAATNTEREKNGLPPLEVNIMLNAAASLKLRDMFDHQYFEHISPSGAGPADLATKVGYEYTIIGENLALGNFTNDAELVTAWMNSPGHRANILHHRYTEIGVAVGRGIFEGHSTWLAVQEFGAPLSMCPQPEAALKSKIQASESELAQLLASIESSRRDLENTSRYDPSYNQKVEEHNVLVRRYNDLAQQSRAMVDEYNNEIKAFNACLAGGV